MPQDRDVYKLYTILELREKKSIHGNTQTPDKFRVCPEDSSQTWR